MSALNFEDGTVLPIYDSLEEAFPFLPNDTETETFHPVNPLPPDLGIISEATQTHN